MSTRRSWPSWCGPPFGRQAGGSRARTVASSRCSSSGLLRPEAWILVGAYWLFSGVRRRDPRLAGRARGAGDLGARGPGRHRRPAALVQRHHGAGRRPRAQHRPVVRPRSFVSFLAGTVRPPVALAALGGIALGWRLRGLRAMTVPLALLGAGVLTFVATAVAGSSRCCRATSRCPRWRCACSRATASPGSRRSRRAARCGARGRAPGGPGGRRRGVRRRQGPGRRAVGPAELRFTRDTHRPARRAAAPAAGRTGLRCGPLTFPNYRLVPDSAGSSICRRRVRARSARRRDRGVAVFLLAQKALKRYGFAAGARPATNAPDPGFAPVTRRRMFSAYAACGGRERERQPSRRARRARSCTPSSWGRSQSGMFCSRAVCSRRPGAQLEVGAHAGAGLLAQRRGERPRRRAPWSPRAPSCSRRRGSG